MNEGLLVSTWQKVFVRWSDGSLQTVAEHGKPFYGITWNAEYLFVGARAWEEKHHEQLLIFDRDFKLLETQDLPTGGSLHQLLWNDAWGLLVCDTPNDRILLWNAESAQVEQEWRWCAELGQDKHHLNSVWVDGAGRIWVTSLHGQVWCRQGGIYGERFRIFQDYGGELHNVFVEDGNLYVGVSDHEALLVHDLVCEEQREISLSAHAGVTEDPNDLRHCYTRGLARSKEHFFVGGAAVQDERTERWQGGSVIVVFDNQLNFVEVLRFDDTGGMHDVRVLGVDRAHNRIPW